MLDWMLDVAGIFAYLNYLIPATRQEILDILINGLKRLEYRGYDSAGEDTAHLLTCLFGFHQACQ